MKIFDYSISLTPRFDIAASEARMLSLPQAPCPVVHRFGPGIYIREVTLPAGAMAIGHRQRHEHTNMMLKGRVRLQQDDGSWRELVAPLFFIGKPGRKIGYVIEETVWQNIYATSETDIETLEAMLLEKSDGWIAADAQRFAQAAQACALDRSDYRLMLEQTGFTEAVARAQSENASDQIPMPPGYSVRVMSSPIEGRGLFLTSPVGAGDVIAPARIAGRRTPAGRFTNHSATPNAFMRQRGSDIDLVALRDIEGCCGGDQGEEVTIDYRQALKLRMEELCQQ